MAAFQQPPGQMCYYDEFTVHTSLVSLLSLQKNSNIFKLEVSLEVPSLMAPLSWQVDGIVGQTSNLSAPPFHVDHGDAIY